MLDCGSASHGADEVLQGLMESGIGRAPGDHRPWPLAMFELVFSAVHASAVPP
jgi:hypothetical protein